MKKINLKDNKLQELSEFKQELKRIIGKSENLTRFDFEKYISKMYEVKFYDNLQECYDNNKINIKVTNIKDFVDVLAFPVVEGEYRVACISEKYNTRYGKVLVFYSYSDNIITDMFIDNIGLQYSSFFGIFEFNGEEKIKKNINLYL